MLSELQRAAGRGVAASRIRPGTWRARVEGDNAAALQQERAAVAAATVADGGDDGLRLSRMLVRKLRHAAAAARGSRVRAFVLWDAIQRRHSRARFADYDREVRADRGVPRRTRPRAVSRLPANDAGGAAASPTPWTRR